MSCNFYQIGGFQPHIQWSDYSFNYHCVCHVNLWPSRWQAGRGYNDDKKLVEEIAGRNSPLWPQQGEPIELVLGIKRIGTSHLLLSERQVRDLARAYKQPFPRRSVHASEFESLSPIYFHNREEFEQTFGRLKIKYIKGRKPWDNSQENKAFSTSEYHPERGAFEHGRLFYRILGGRGRIDSEKFNLHDLSWADSVQIYSFSISLRSPDTRPSQDRINRPIALDCGLAQAAFDLSYREASAIHYSSYNNRVLGAGSPKLPFEHGETEELDDMTLSARLRDFFSARIHECSPGGSKPIILLVHNEIVSMNMLKNCGVDTSSWKSGLRDLVHFSVPQDYRHDRRRRDEPRYRDDRYERGGYNGITERSLSPRPSASTSQLRYDSPPPRRTSFAPVYVVDIKTYYTTLMQATTASESVNAIAGPLGLDLVDIKGWCAGNDAVTMLKIWHAMVSGPSINEQRELRMKNRDPRVRAAKVAATYTGTSGNNSDFDPTTITLPMQEEINHDDSDYGESSGSDD
ncbi:hypothetical protein C0995_003211 [Termitomyces sp. Mi166|nr:hypothetical protein C0995_003211 [Termitomyces sp. Mi166\